MREALANLKWLAGTAGRQVSFDLADLRGYAYYSGVRFRHLHAGASDALVRGGRYDEVGAVFGRNRPAVGFSLDVKELVGVAAARRCKAAIRAPGWTATPSGRLRAAIARCAAGRDRGLRAAGPRERSGRIPVRPRARRRGRPLGRQGHLNPFFRKIADDEDKGPQRGRGRHPVGRRGQGQAGRLADRDGAGRGALPGRPQRRPHAGHQRREDGAAPDPSGIMRPGVKCYIGNGVVLSAAKLFEEIEGWRKAGVEVRSRCASARPAR
jgi:hypothetical protein